MSFVFEFGIFWSKAKMIFGQSQAILLLGPSTTGVTEEEQQEQQEKQEKENVLVIVY